MKYKPFILPISVIALAMFLDYADEGIKYFITGCWDTRMEFVRKIVVGPIKYKNIKLITKDNIQVNAWLVYPENFNENTKFMLTLHGNFVNRGEYCQGFHLDEKVLKLNLMLLILDYRNFGDSFGRFYSSKVPYDIEVCLEYAHNVLKFAQVDVCAYSLGTGIILEYLKYAKKNNLIENESKILTKESHYKVLQTILNDKDVEYKYTGKGIAKVNRIAMLSSTVSITHTVVGFGNSWKFFHYFGFKIVRYLVKNYELDSFDNIKYVDPNKILFLHGDKDTITSVENIEQVINKINAKYAVMQGLSHWKVADCIQSWEEVLKFMEDK